MKKSLLSLIIIVILATFAMSAVGCNKEVPANFNGEYIAGDSEAPVGTLRIADSNVFSLSYNNNTEWVTANGSVTMSGKKLKFKTESGKKFNGAIDGESISIVYDGITFNFTKKTENQNPDNPDEGDEVPPEKHGYNCEHFYTSSFEIIGDAITTSVYSNSLKPYVGDVENARFGFQLKNALTYKTGFFSRIFMNNELSVEVTDGIVPVNFGENICYLVIDNNEETNISVYKFNIYIVKEYTVSFYDVSVLTGAETLFKDSIVYENKTLEKIESPKQYGVTFVSWTTKDGAVFDMTRKINENINLYSTYDKIAIIFNWEPSNKKIAYVTKGESCKTEDLPTAKPDGYRLNGWYTDSGEKWDEKSVCNKNINLTARWEKDNISEFFSFIYEPTTNSFTVSAYLGSNAYVIIPESYKPDEVTADDAARGLTESVELPVGAIADDVFKGKLSLKEIFIPSSVKKIGARAFDGCSELEKINLPSELTYIYSFTFAGCSKLTKITLPSTVTGIGASAFSGCTMLNEVNIPTSVTGIGKLAFYNCASLTEIFIPKNVTFIDAEVFKSCSKLTITIEFETPPIGWNPNWNIDGRPVK